MKSANKAETGRGQPGRKAATKQKPRSEVRQAGAADDHSTKAERERPTISPPLEYRPELGIDEFVYRVASATPLELIEAERAGVAGRFLKDVSRRMDLPATRLFAMAGVPKATAEKKAASGERVSGRAGQAALGIARLLAKAQSIVDNSTSVSAKDFNTAEWLGRWLETPQPSLGGRKPGDLIDTPTGLEVVSRLLGALENGAYQ